MSYNDGAKIVPIAELAKILCAAKGADQADVPGNYARVQLLTREAMHDLVFKSHDRSYIVYGADSPDMPLCMDFAIICFSDVLRGAIKAGLAVRPAFGTIEYTKNSGDRHSINFAAYADGTLEFYEPQTDTWMDQPDDCKSIETFSLGGSEA